ncbi:MAG: cupin domain-containing protein [Eubacteriales bacterium]|nr:cupin domain-containing protein [Eubacteriales bacterium]
MELLRRDDLNVQMLPGRIITNIVGKGSAYPEQSEKMTICFAHYSAESGPMEPHNHAEETVVVLSGTKCYVKYGDAKDNLTEKRELKAGDAMHFPELEWHVFGYEEGGYLDVICIYGQVDNIRPEDILKNK